MFGLHTDGGVDKVYLRDPTGHQIPTAGPPYVDIDLPYRATNSRVVHVTELRRRLNQAHAAAATAAAVNVTGSASYAIAVLDPPWRQRFEGTVDMAGTQETSGGFVSNLQIAERVTLNTTFDEVKNLVTLYGS